MLIASDLGDRLFLSKTRFLLMARYIFIRYSHKEIEITKKDTDPKISYKLVSVFSFIHFRPGINNELFSPSFILTELRILSSITMLK